MLSFKDSTNLRYCRPYNMKILFIFENDNIIVNTFVMNFLVLDSLHFISFLRVKESGEGS